MYEQLQEELRKQDAVRDLASVWNTLTPLDARTEGRPAEMLDSFCVSKGITKAALAAQEARIRLMGRGPDVFLAFPGYGTYRGRETVTAIKYRNLGNGRRLAEAGSTFGHANVIGNHSSLDYFVCEGETDACRIWDLLGQEVAIMVLPAGALAFKRKWFDYIPRGATLYLCHDADEAGDAGAAKVARVVGNTVRVRPPLKDWGMWPGTREEFIAIVKEARGHLNHRVQMMSDWRRRLEEERAGDRDPVRLGYGGLDANLRGISDGQVLGIAARTNVGKTWMLSSIVDNIAVADFGQLILSLEMPGLEWAERQWAINDGVSTSEIENRVKTGPQATEAFDRRYRHTAVCDRPLRLDELPHICAETRALLTVPLRVLFIDYLGLLLAQGKDAYERTSTIGRGLKQLAKEEQVAIIVAMQLNRAAGDGSGEVTLEMMRDSGVIEESMDFLLGCWRPNFNNTGPDVMRVKVLKNRKGKGGGRIDLTFHQPSMKVIEVPVRKAS